MLTTCPSIQAKCVGTPVAGIVGCLSAPSQNIKKYSVGCLRGGAPTLSSFKSFAPRAPASARPWTESPPRPSGRRKWKRRAEALPARGMEEDYPYRVWIRTDTTSVSPEHRQYDRTFTGLPFCIRICGFTQTRPGILTSTWSFMPAESARFFIIMD